MRERSQKTNPKRMASKTMGSSSFSVNGKCGFRTGRCEGRKGAGRRGED